MGQEAVLQAGQELQQVPSTGETQGWPLDAILAHQDNCATTVHCREQTQPSAREMAQGRKAQGTEIPCVDSPLSQALGKGWDHPLGNQSPALQGALPARSWGKHFPGGTEITGATQSSGHLPWSQSRATGTAQR